MTGCKCTVVSSLTKAVFPFSLNCEISKIDKMCFSLPFLPVNYTMTLTRKWSYGPLGVLTPQAEIHRPTSTLTLIVKSNWEQLI